MYCYHSSTLHNAALLSFSSMPPRETVATCADFGHRTLFNRAVHFCGGSANSCFAYASASSPCSLAPDLSVCWLSRDTLGAGFAGLGKSAAVVSQQLAQDVNRTTQGTTSELQNRSEEVYAGAVDGLSSSDINAVVEELENGVNSVVQGVEHEAEVLKKAFQEALHRAMGSVALLGREFMMQMSRLNGPKAWLVCVL